MNAPPAFPTILTDPTPVGRQATPLSVRARPYRAIQASLPPRSNRRLAPTFQYLFRTPVIHPPGVFRHRQEHPRQYETRRLRRNRPRHPLRVKTSAVSLDLQSDRRSRSSRTPGPGHVPFQSLALGSKDWLTAVPMALNSSITADEQTRTR